MEDWEIEELGVGDWGIGAFVDWEIWGIDWEIWRFGVIDKVRIEDWGYFVLGIGGLGTGERKIHTWKMS